MATVENGTKWVEQVSLAERHPVRPVSQIHSSHAAYFQELNERDAGIRQFFLGTPLLHIRGQMCRDLRPGDERGTAGRADLRRRRHDPHGRSLPQMSSGGVHRRPARRRLPGQAPGARGTDTRTASWPVLAAVPGPALLIYAGMTAYPALRTFYDSLFTIDDPTAPEFAGLPTTRRFGRTTTFWRAVLNTLIWSVAAPVLDVGDRPAAGVVPVCQGAVRPVPAHRLVHPGAAVLRGRRDPVAMDLQLRLGRGEPGCCARSGSAAWRRPGSATRIWRWPR